MTQARLLIVAFGGLGIVGLHFTIVYVFAALACARGFAGQSLLGIGIVPAVNGLVTVAALLACVWILLAAGAVRPRAEASDSFLRWLSVAFALIGILSIVWIALPLLFTPGCT